MELILLVAILILNIVLLIICSVNRKNATKMLCDHLLKDINNLNNVIGYNIKIHPEVLKIYQDWIKDPNSFKSAHCTVDNLDKSISIWSANNKCNRRFYNGCSLMSINNDLSYYDELILDAIVKNTQKREKIISDKFLSLIGQ